jgi:hypothetical protein
MRVQFCKLNPSVRVSNRDSEPLGSNYKREPTEALYLAKLLQNITFSGACQFSLRFASSAIAQNE